MDKDTSYLDETWWSDPSPETVRRIDRLTRRGRNFRPPPGLGSGEECRRWLLDMVDLLAPADETAEERQETAEWRERIVTATAADLWSQYGRKASVEPTTNPGPAWWPYPEHVTRNMEGPMPGSEQSCGCHVRRPDVAPRRRLHRIAGPDCTARATG